VVWLRSANYSNTNNECNGQADGSLNNNNANNTYRLLPDRILRNQQMPVT